MHLINLGFKIKTFFSRLVVFSSSIIMNYIVFIGLSVISGGQIPNKPDIFTIIIITQLLFSLFISVIIILGNNRTIQDFLSNTKYIENVRIRLMIKSIMKHLILGFFIFTFFGRFGSNKDIFFLCFSTFYIVDNIILFFSSKYTSIYDIVLYKKRS